MKKIGLILLAALLCTGMLIGCGGNDDDPPATGGKVKITFDPDGGTLAEGQATTLEVESGKSVGAGNWPIDPTRGLDTFQGWFDGETEYTSSTAISKDVTVKAKWKVDGPSENPFQIKLGTKYVDAEIEGVLIDSITYHEDDNDKTVIYRFTLGDAEGWGNAYTQFKVDFAAEGYELSDFYQVKFDITGLAGNAGWKPVGVVAADQEIFGFLGANPQANDFGPGSGSSAYTGDELFSDFADVVALAAPIDTGSAVGVKVSMTFPLLADRIAAIEDDVLWISLYVHANPGGSYEIANVEFVLTPDGLCAECENDPCICCPVCERYPCMCVDARTDIWSLATWLTAASEGEQTGNLASPLQKTSGVYTVTTGKASLEISNRSDSWHGVDVILGSFNLLPGNNIYVFTVTGNVIGEVPTNNTRIVISNGASVNLHLEVLDEEEDAEFTAVYSLPADFAFGTLRIGSDTAGKDLGINITGITLVNTGTRD